MSEVIEEKNEALVVTAPIEHGFSHSATVGKIAAALAKAQGMYETATKDTSNPFFKSKYADLATVIGATRKALSQNGIAVIQSLQEDDSRKAVVITTLLVHSEEWFRGELAIPCPKWDAQGLGSASTYGRRYALQALLCVAGEDDDGNAATEASNATKREEIEKKHIPAMDGQARIAQFQVDNFWKGCKATGKTEAMVSAYLQKLNGYVQVEEIQKQDFNAAIKWALDPKAQSPSTSEETVQKLQDSVSQAKFRKLFALAKEKNIPESDINTYVFEAFGRHSKKDLTETQFDSLLEWVSAQ